MQKTRKMVKLSVLRNAKHNPPNRTEPAAIKSLAASMDSLGQLMPIIVTASNVIVDGHRRVASAKSNGWKEIEATIVSDDKADEIFGSANTTARKLTGHDALCVYRVNPNAVNDVTRAKFDEMAKVLGRPLFRLMIDKGYSQKVYMFAKRIAAYCESEDTETIRQSVEWLMLYPVTKQLEIAMANGEPPQSLLMAVRKGKPVKLRLQMG